MLRERQREAASGPTSHSSSGAAPPPPDRGTRRPAPLLLDAHDGVETGMPQGAPNGTAGPADRDGDRFRRTGDRAEQGVGTRELTRRSRMVHHRVEILAPPDSVTAAAPKATVICVDGDA